MNYPFLILSFFLLCCLVCFLTLPAMATETTEATVPETQATTEATEEPYTEAPTESFPEAPEETFQEVYTVPEETQPNYIEIIQDTGNAIVHADLFGAFLICGTLVGIFLLRGRYGT